MSDAATETLAGRIKARPLLYWGLRAVAIVSLAAGQSVWPTMESASPLAWLLFAGTLMHYVQKALFGIPFFTFQTLYYDIVVVLSALALHIVAQAILRD